MGDALSKSGANKVSKPIAGINGVYIAMVTATREGSNQDLKGEQLRLAQQTNYRVTSQAVEVQKTKAEITDKRAKFY